MIVVARRRSASRDVNASIAFSSSFSRIAPCATAIRRFGSELLELLLHAADRLDAVVDEEDLPAAVELRLDRLADDLGLPRHDLRLDREPVPRRRLDDREVAQAREREVERPRDRRRRHREDVDRRLPLLQALLLRDAEALLLVHDREGRDRGTRGPSRASGASR